MSGNNFVMPAPDDWVRAPLNEITQLISRGTAPVYVDSSPILAIGQRCIQETGFEVTATRCHDQRYLSGVLHPNPGDVLLNSTGTGTIGRSCVFTNIGREFIVDTHVTTIRPCADIVDGRWLNALLSSPWGQNHLETRCYTGSTNQIELSRERLANSIVPVPTLQEQGRIAEVLGAIEERIDTVRRITKKRYEVRAGLLRDALRTLSMTEPLSGWLRLPLGEVVPSVDYGISHALTEEPTGLPVLRMNNVGEGKAGFGELKYYPRNVPHDLLLRYGDVLFNRTNSVEHVGRSGMWRDELSGATFASYLVRLNVNPTRLIPGYLALWLSHPLIRQRVRAISTPAVQQVNVNPTKLRSLPIDLPSSLDEQRRITGLLDIADTQIAREQAELDKFRLLKAGLMGDLLTGRVRVTSGGELTG